MTYLDSAIAFGGDCAKQMHHLTHIDVVIFRHAVQRHQRIEDDHVNAVLDDGGGDLRQR
jgi:hypothetical protein